MLFLDLPPSVSLSLFLRLSLSLSLFVSLSLVGVSPVVAPARVVVVVCFSTACTVHDRAHHRGCRWCCFDWDHLAVVQLDQVH